MFVGEGSLESWLKSPEEIQWFHDILKDATCNICGEKVLNRKKFLWWRADSDIILCYECADHTLTGLNRDLLEMEGDKTAIGQSGISIVDLKLEINRLKEAQCL